MRIEQLAADVYVFVGEAYLSVSTALINDDEVLLIDGLASHKDAKWLSDFLEIELRKQIRFILCTHYMSDHMAAFKLFPKAPILAHRDYLLTFASQNSLTDEEREYFVRPSIEISDGVVMKWGGYTLDIFHNASKAVSMLSVDIPEADLLLVGDAFFGNTIFLSSAGEPALFEKALRRLQRRGRSRVVPGHIGVYNEQALDNALFYLRSLRAHVEEARKSSRVEDSILEIPIGSCLAPHLRASDFEKEYHLLNLKLIVERKLFTERS